MIHIIKNPDGTFDQATVRNGKLIQRSKQGYENREDVINTIISDMKEICLPLGGYCYRWIQDDTSRKSAILSVWSDGDVFKLNEKPDKKYRPK